MPLSYFLRIPLENIAKVKYTWAWVVEGKRNKDRKTERQKQRNRSRKNDRPIERKKTEERKRERERKKNKDRAFH